MLPTVATTRWLGNCGSPASGAGRALRAVPAGRGRAAPRVLRERGIDQLYTHQAHAVDRCSPAQRRHYDANGLRQDALLQRPVLSGVLRDSATRALYMFPTKRSPRTIGRVCTRCPICSRVVASSRSGYSPTTATRLRRTAGDPRPRACGLEQSRHGAFGNPCRTSRWAKLFGISDTSSSGTSSRVIRCIRQPLDQRAAPIAPRLRHYGSPRRSFARLPRLRIRASSPRRSSRSHSSSCQRAGRRAARSSSSSSTRVVNQQLGIRAPTG